MDGNPKLRRLYTLAEQFVAPFRLEYWVSTAGMAGLNEILKAGLLDAASRRRSMQPSYLEDPPGQQPNAPTIVRHTSFTVKGEAVPDGVIILAVAPAWYDMLDWIRLNRHRAHELGASVWEEMVAAAYQAAGFEDVVLTRRSGDFGRDVEATLKAPDGTRILLFDQVKAYSPGHVVTANDVRALALVSKVGASVGIVTTTSTFAPRIHSDKFLAPELAARRLRLRPRDELYVWLDELLQQQRASSRR